jgi:protein-tyrosine phosphatase
MTDIHTHILPGVDDGARDLDEAIQMLELAHEAGTKAMIATPHADLRYQFDPEQSASSRALLQARCPQGPRLYSGCEVHLTPENMERVLQKPSDFTLNGGDCLLLELPNLVMPSMVDPAIQALSDSGLRIIIAHPERNPYIQRHMAYAEALVNKGCYLQLTARSLSGGFGPGVLSTATQMMKRRLAHFIASDAHGAIKRKPGLADVYETVETSFGETAARTLLIDNPEAVLSNSAIRSMPVASGWLKSLFSRSSHAHSEQRHAHLR